MHFFTTPRPLYSSIASNKGLNSFGVVTAEKCLTSIFFNALDKFEAGLWVSLPVSIA